MQIPTALTKGKIEEFFSYKPLTWFHLYHYHKLDPRCFKYQLFHNLIWLIYSCGFLLLFLLFFFQCNRWDSEEIGLLLLLQKAGKRIIAFLHLCEPIFFQFLFSFFCLLFVLSFFFIISQVFPYAAPSTYVRHLPLWLILVDHADIYVS